MNTAHEPVTYDLDQGNRIVATGGSWDEFAVQNAAAELATPAVLGQPLWRFIQGEEVRHLLRLILDRAREDSTRVSVPFRCDAPALRRYMQMNVYPLPGGMLRVESILQRAEPRAYVALLDRSSRLLYGMLTICSWCKRIRLFNREWVEVEEAVTRLNLFHSIDLPFLSHGICLPCAKRTFHVVEVYETGDSR